MSQTPPRTIGIDLGDRRSHICVLDADGKVLSETTLSTTADGLRGWFRRQGPSRVVLEASTHSRWVSQLLLELGHEAVVANPRKVALIFNSMRKNDRIDAERLARLGRVDTALLSPITHRSDAAQQGLLSVKARDALVGSRTALINQVRSACKSFGVRIPSCSARCFHERACASIPVDLQQVLAPLIATIADTTVRIRELDGVILDLCREVYPETELLRQIPGVGPITALTYLLTIDDPTRFEDSRDVGAYLGLTPRQDQSGARDKALPITKAGDRMLRALLVQAAHYVCGPFGPESDLRAWAHRRIEGGLTKRKALVAVARKLAVLLHRLWVTGEVYRPLRAAA